MPSWVLPRRVLHYVERNYLNNKEQTHKQILVLYSSDETGKSVIANEFGHQFKNESNLNYVYWIYNDNFEKQIKKFAQTIQIPDGFNLNEIFEKIKTKLIESNKRVLFIFDNCNNFENIENFIRHLERNILVLITTRDSSLKDKLSEKYAHIIYLQPFTQEESIEFLKNNIDSKVNEEDLVKLLNSTNFFSNQRIRPYDLNKLVELVNSKTRFKTLNRLICDQEQINSLILNINNIIHNNNT